MKFLFLIVSAGLFASTFAFTPANRHPENVPQQNPKSSSPVTPPLGKIPSVLKENGLTTLVDLITKAGLAQTLSGEGSFTVWAPTNEAFAAFATIDSSTLTAVLNDASSLKDVLTYHLVPFKISPTLIPSVHTELTLPSVQGEIVRINVYRKKGSSFSSETVVTVNGGLVITILQAGNGVIYVIDKVLNPKDLKLGNTQIEILRETGDFTTLVKMFDTLGITKISDKIRPKTLFAPTDAAFQALPSGVLEALFANKAEMGKLINKHTLSGTWYSNGLVSGPLPLFSGDTVKVVVSARGIRVGNANVIGADLSETEGVVHVIDAVIQL
ncbi:hypothetical protein DAPPUDRAFT_300909 [Daphnia pulex]|uniref:FAS1 domain-containing protein n=1 Tax=Daphnia pulex TaxID=6669 RepID=E9HFF1_DAPPU|nr:hypothetical protein DAPPUDRAFT_300909 [Daphnia pulex]|eukprot:EFX69547.1 hypothetical protein DAPPUDRAFT_300909 [Daphnia pulex]